MKNVYLRFSFPSMIKTKICYFPSFLSILAIFAIFALFWGSLRDPVAPFPLFIN